MLVAMTRLRLLLPAVTVILGAAMLAIPWALPLERGAGRVLVFVIAGIVELVLGVALAFFVLHERPEGMDAARPSYQRPGRGHARAGSPHRSRSGDGSRWT
jgi:hypothetical protein